MNHRLLTLTLLAAALAACSSIPERNSALDQARSRVEAARLDAQVSALAPDELKAAGDTLTRAEKARLDGASTADIDHLAYMTTQRVTIAQETAWSKAAQAVTAGAAAERDKMRLAERTKEADMAQAQLANSRDSNARKTAELAQADAAALRDQGRVERRDARLNDLEAQLKELNAKKTERGMVVTLGDVLFDTGLANLRGASSGDMTKLANFFKRNPKRSASIEGYTDSVGGASANMDLSERRAQSVKAALVMLGVPLERLSTRAHGEEDPAASNDSAAGRQMNRRVEIVFASDDVSVR